ncbi:MAG: OmpA family protein [Bacteroidota bacterium]|nr:OmpA family protein [Candidatus Kapabacteria bacterium]MDW8219994.1 OmpA family protein [Bacteroidota bacterium]
MKFVIHARYSILTRLLTALISCYLAYTPCYPQSLRKMRLPEEFSAHQPTILPVATSDGKRLYFDRKNFAGNTGGIHDYDDIWFADKNSDGTWLKARNLGTPLNTEGSDVLCSLSPDNRMALVYGVYDSQLPVKREGFSLARCKSGTWLFPEPIVIKNFYNRAKKYYARLAPDNRTLLLALQRDESLGGLDLYVSFRQDTSLVWSEPLHLGSTLNTSGYEGSPHLAPDGKTLYFSSEGHGGNGLADLFVTRRLDESWQRWSPPVNLGTLINTNHEDSSIDISLDGKTAYFLSSDTAGNKGLYFATLPEEMRHTGAVMLMGKVRLALPTTKPAKYTKHENTIQQVSIDRNVYVLAYSVRKDSLAILHPVIESLTTVSLDDGTYAMVLPAGKIYVVKAFIPNAPDVTSWVAVLDTRQPRFHAGSRLEYREQDIILGAPRKSISIEFPPIHFAQEQAILPDSSFSVPALVAFAYTACQAAQHHQHAKQTSIEIVGHTCDLGRSSMNDSLAQERARAVAEEVKRYGIPDTAIIMRGEGERKPLVRSASAEHRARNRRVEVRIIQH